MSTRGDWTLWQRFLVYGSAPGWSACRPWAGCGSRASSTLSGDPGLKSGPLIVVANHASNVDPPLVAGWLGPALRRRSDGAGQGGAVPWSARGRSCAAQAWSWSSPVARTSTPYRATKAVLDRGDVILLFPEGTRSPDGRHRRGAHAGVAMLAARAGVRVLPVGLSGTDR